MIDKKCPKCDSRNFTMELKATCYLLYIVDNGKVISNGIEMDAGRVLETKCCCSECGYKWTSGEYNFVVDG